MNEVNYYIKYGYSPFEYIINGGEYITSEVNKHQITIITYESLNDYSLSNKNRYFQGMIISGLIVITYWIGSIIDANHCAKVNNLYNRIFSIKPNLQPNINYGLTLSFSF